MVQKHRAIYCLTTCVKLSDNPHAGRHLTVLSYRDALSAPDLIQVYDPNQLHPQNSLSRRTHNPLLVQPGIRHSGHSLLLKPLIPHMYAILRRLFIWW